MALAALRRLRIGVLVSVAFAALLLWGSTEAPWWSARTDVGGFQRSEVSLTGFGGNAFGWCAAVACLAIAVAAVPAPRRVHRTAVTVALAAWVATVAWWVVLLGRVLSWDAEVRRGWTAEIWARHAGRASTGAGPAVAQTEAEGPNLALTLMFLLLTIGVVVAVPRRHERGVLLTAAMVSAVTALTTTTVTVWVTTGPQTARRDWTWMPALLAAAKPTVVVLAVMVPILAVGLLLRPGGRLPRAWRVTWATAACLYCYGSFFVILIDTASGFPLHPHDTATVAAPPTHWGVGLTELFALPALLPLVVMIRVVCADARVVKRAAAVAGGSSTGHHEPAAPPVADAASAVEDDEVREPVPDDRPPPGGWT